MRRLIRFACVFSVLTLLFSLYTPMFAKDNDARFDRYINMGQNAVNNNYEIPNMFRQDAPYAYSAKFPLVVNGGTEYVPLSMFILYSFVNVTYGSTGENFYLVNNRNNHYISFDIQSGTARTHTGDTLDLSTRIYNQTRYVPARKVCDVLGFKYESYDNTDKGIYAFRISDGRSEKSLMQVLEPYLPEEPKVEDPPVVDPPKPPVVDPPKPPVVDPPKPPVVDPPKPPVIEIPEDPIEKIADRRVAVCFGGMEYANMTRISDTLDSCGVKASFAFAKEDIIGNTSLLRTLLSKGHSIFVTAEIIAEDVTVPEDNTEENTTENAAEVAKLLAEEYVKRLEEANKALFLTVKKKTRMCLLPYGLSDEVKYSKEFLNVVEKAGYVPLVPNTNLADGPGYTGSAKTLSTAIRNKIVDGFDVKKAAVVTVSLYCSDKTAAVISDVAELVNKYDRFEFSAFNEALLYNEKE